MSPSPYARLGTRFFAGIVCFAVAATPAARAAAPQIRIATFSGDRAAAISYTFDDGLRDQYTLAAPMLDEVGFKGTFFVIAGKVSATVEDAERRKTDKRAWGTITWPELKDMAARGHEIASHTWSHRNLPKLPPDEIEAELSRSSDAIKQNIGTTPLTLAFPFNSSNPEIEAAALKRYAAIRDFQTGFGGEKSTVESLDAWADHQIRDHAWGVAMIHGICQGYAAFTDPEILRTHLRHVKSREAEVWVDTFANVARYTKERADAKVGITASSTDGVTCTLSGTLDPAIYDVPLTLVLDVPGAKSARAERDGHALPARVTAASIHVEAAPAAAPITITWH